MDSEHSNKVDQYKLQQEEAALKVKLAYVEQEKTLEIEKLIKEQKMEKLKLKRDLELNSAKLNVFEENTIHLLPLIIFPLSRCLQQNLSVYLSMKT